MIRVNLLKWPISQSETPCSKIVTRRAFRSGHDISVVPFPGRSIAIVRGQVRVRFVERVLVRLAESRDREVNPWLRDDLAIAWLTVLRASEGDVNPYFTAFWQVLGATPDKLIPFFVARAEADTDPFWADKSLPFTYSHDWRERFAIAKAVADGRRKKPSGSVRPQVDKENAA